MIRRLLAIWPPPWALGTAAFVYLTFQSMILTSEWFEGGRFFRRGGEPAEIILFLSFGFIGFYALFRVGGFHPAFRAGYYEWLRHTPWTSAKPLPMGPIHLVWQDVAIVSLVYGLACVRSTEEVSFSVVKVFMTCYLIALGTAHYWTGKKVWAYATFFASCFLIAFWRDDWRLFSFAAAVTYAIAFFGLRVSLAAWPWEDVKSLQKTFQNISAINNRDQKDPKLLGWPYDRLAPPKSEEVDTPWDVIYVMGILLAAWMFVVYHYLRFDMPDRGYLVLYGYMVSGIIGRVCAYCNGYAPPINFWGRILTFRWIIPGYDQVIVAPFCALVVGVAAWYVPGWLGGIDPLWVSPPAFILIWWILMGMPPSLREWRLTGNHRIVPAMMPNVRSQ